MPSKLDLALYGLLALAAAGLLVTINSWRLDSARLKVVARELTDEKKGRARDLEQYTRNQEKTQEHGRDYDNKIDQQHAERADTPTRVVRLCEPRLPTSISARNSPVADHAKGGAELPQAPRRDPEEGPDIGPELYSEADRADDIAIELNACIDWVEANP